MPAIAEVDLSLSKAYAAGTFDSPPAIRRIGSILALPDLNLNLNGLAGGIILPAPAA